MPFRGFGMLVDGLKSCGSAIDLVCTMALGPKTDTRVYYETIAQCLRDTSPGADGISVVPYFNGGLRSSLGSPPALIRGFKDSKQKHLVRAVFEAIAYHIRLIIESFESATSAHIQRILVGGGPSRSPEFMRIVADVANREVHVTKYSDSGLLGCAVCAGTGLNWFENYHQASQKLVSSTEVIQPSPPAVIAYNDLYGQYRHELPLAKGDTQEIRHAC
jgi:sugar (pentulose or hexulose) kinase